MAKPFGVYFDVDGCMMMKSGKPVFRSTAYCEYNDIDVPSVLGGLTDHGAVNRDAVKSYVSRFGDIRTPADLIRLGEYARFDQDLKSAGISIGKEQLKEIEDNATKGLPLEAVYHSLQDTQMTPGLEEFAAWAKSGGAKQFIVTNGWDIVARYLADRLGIDRVVGYGPVFKGGRFTGEVRPIGPKEHEISELMKELGVTYRHSIGIDDADAVIGQFGLPVVFCPTNQKLRGIAGAVIIETYDYTPVKSAAELWLTDVA